MSAPVAEGGLSLIRHAGGFAVSNPLIMVVSAGDIPQHLRVTAESVLLLYSADFFDTWLGGLRFVALLELAGLALAGQRPASPCGELSGTAAGSAR